MTWRPLSPHPSSREPRSVRESLERIAAGFGLASPDVLGQVFSRWEELVGADVAAHATPRSLRQGVLTVVVDHPAWASSLRLFTGRLLGRIADAAGEGHVHEVVVRVESGPAGSGRKRPA